MNRCPRLREVFTSPTTEYKTRADLARVKSLQAKDTLAPSSSSNFVLFAHVRPFE